MPAITVPLIQVWDQLMLSGGSSSPAQPVANARIRATLNYTDATYLNPLTTLSTAQVETSTDQNGYWTLYLAANDQISPANTTWNIRTPLGNYNVSVTSGGVPVGGWQTANILVTSPPLLNPVSQTIGSLTVTGAFTVGGALTATGGVDSAGRIRIGGTGFINDIGPNALNLATSRYACDPTGTAASDTGMNQAIADAMASGLPITGPAGTYKFNNPIIVQPAANGAHPVPAPSIIGPAAPGRAGDDTDLLTFSFFPSGTFPAGKFLLQFLSPTTTVAPTGATIKNVGLDCRSNSGGLLLVQPRLFTVEHVMIDHAADASGSGSPVGAAGTGAFTAWSITGTAPAYNHFNHITTAFSAKDGFAHNLLSDDVFFQPTDLNSTRYAFNCQGSARWFAPHYELSQYGFLVVVGLVQQTFMGIDFFGIPTQNALQLQSNWSSGYNNAAQFIGCRFAVNPGSFSVTSTPILAQGAAALFANFVGCDIVAQGNTEYYAVSSGPPVGSRVTFSACNFTGTVNNGIANDTNNIFRFRGSPGVNPLAVTTPAVSTPLTNTFNVDIYVSFIANAAGTTFTVNGKALAATPANAQGGFMWPGGTVMSYVGVPASWAFIGL